MPSEKKDWDFVSSAAGFLVVIALALYLGATAFTPMEPQPKVLLYGGVLGFPLILPFGHLMRLGKLVGKNLPWGSDE